MKKTPQPNRFHTLITPYISVIAISKLPPKKHPPQGLSVDRPVTPAQNQNVVCRLVPGSGSETGSYRRLSKKILAAPLYPTLFLAPE